MCFFRHDSFFRRNTSLGPSLPQGGHPAAPDSAGHNITKENREIDRALEDILLGIRHVLNALHIKCLAAVCCDRFDSFVHGFDFFGLHAHS